MACNSSISSDATVILQGRENINLRFSDDIKNSLVTNLQEEDMWKLKILLRSILTETDITNIATFEDMYHLLSTCIQNNSELTMLMAELFYTIQRFDLLKIMGSCKHRLGHYFNSPVKLKNEWITRYKSIEDRDIEEGDKLISQYVCTNQAPSVNEVHPDRELMTPSSSFENSPFNSQNVDMDYEHRSIQLYPWRHSPCGICMIINNEKFQNGLTDRVGSSKDKENLIELFENFDFTIKKWENLSASEMKTVLQRESCSDFSKYDALACCILSHGLEDIVYGVDAQPVHIQKEILDLFILNKNKDLIQKPKLFFIQACQGKSKIHYGIKADGIESDDAKFIPAYGDYLLYMATVPGFIAYRSKMNGSWFIENLSTQLKSHGHVNSLLDNLSEVTRKVTEEEYTSKNNEVCKQQPILTCTFTKKFIFKRKQNPVESSR